MQQLILDADNIGNEPAPHYVRAELNRVLDSAEFRATPQRRKMLAYLVEEMIAGRGDKLKGYAIAVSVFGRGEDFDPQADPVVRLEARRLRRDLDSYYVSAGRDNPLRITIPKGHYIPFVSRPEPDKHARTRPSAMESGNPISAGDSEAAMAVSENAVAIPIRDPARWITGAVPAVLLIIALSVYLLPDRWRQQDDGLVSGAGGPALMVLPFEVFQEREADTALAAGLTEQITTELSRFPYFRLYMPRAGTSIDSGTSVDDLKAQGDRLGINYVVSGSVGSDGPMVRIGARLIDVSTGRIVWAGGFDRTRTAGSLLATQSEISAGIVTAIGQPYGIIRTEMTSRLPDELAPSMPSYECVLRGYAYRRSFAKELHAPVQACLEAAVKRDPAYAEAWAMLGWLHLDAGRFGRTPGSDVERAYDRALDAASHAVTIDGDNVLALKALSSINHYMGHYDEGERFARRALEVNPNDPDTLAQLGWRLAVRGKFDEGIPYLAQAIERTANPPGWYYHLIAVDHYLHGRYAQMLTAAKSGVGDESSVSWSLVAIAHGALGNTTAAHEALARMAEISPQLARDPRAVYSRHGATDSIVNSLVAGLRKAGWSEPTDAITTATSN